MGMMFDIAAAREGLKDKIMSDIGLVHSSNNVLDGLTTAMSQAVCVWYRLAGKLLLKRKDGLFGNRATCVVV